jgi:hypothetical protein
MARPFYRASLDGEELPVNWPNPHPEMRPFAAGLAWEILRVLLSIPYGTNNNGILPRTFFEKFSVARRPSGWVDRLEGPVNLAERKILFAD